MIPATNYTIRICKTNPKKESNCGSGPRYILLYKMKKKNPNGQTESEPFSPKSPSINKRQGIASHSISLLMVA